MTQSLSKNDAQLNVGVDISKDTMDVYIHPLGTKKRFANDDVGHQALIAWLAQYPGIVRVVFEPTGPYHGAFERTLDEAGLPMVRADAWRVRQFAKGAGKLAKTDKIDARVLAQFGAAYEPEPRHVVSVVLDELRHLGRARHSLVKGRTANQLRLQAAVYALEKQQLAETIAHFNRQIDAIEARQNEILKADAELKAKAKILISIPGIGKKTAHSLLAGMPELGSLDQGAVGALAGLAPVARDSGKFKGERHIQRGRAPVRCAMFYPAMAAKRFNPFFKGFYDRLFKAGKPFKVALTAVMRKLLILANALLRDKRMWSPTRGEVVAKG